MISVRKADAADTPAMAEILNAIIAQGGTTAMTRAIDAQELESWMSRRTDKSSWLVAVDDRSEVLGFQWIEPADYLPEDAAEIATFARVGKTGLGIGSALFNETRLAAKRLGYGWINANIRSDNTGGLAYYSSRGFKDYGRKDGLVLDDGTVVDKVLKRFDL